MSDTNIDQKKVVTWYLDPTESIQLIQQKQSSIKIDDYEAVSRYALTGKAPDEQQQTSTKLQEPVESSAEPEEEKPAGWGLF